VTHGAGLILRRLIVHRPDWWPSHVVGKVWHCRQSMFTRLTLRSFEDWWNRGACGKLSAALGLHRHVLIDEGTLLVDMALVANGISAGQTSQAAARFAVP
jgi:hypothetical protein